MTCLPHFGAPLVSQMVKNLPAMWETRVLFLGWKDPLEEEMATHSSILAWRIPWTEESGRLQSGVAKSKTRSEQLTLWLSLGGRDRDGGLLSTFPLCICSLCRPACEGNGKCGKCHSCSFSFPSLLSLPRVEILAL